MFMSTIYNKIKKDRTMWIGIFMLTLMGLLLGGFHYEYKNALKEKEPVVELVRYTCICPMCHSKIEDMIEKKNTDVYRFEDLNDEVLDD